MAFYQKIRNHIANEEMVSRATVVKAPEGLEIGAEMLVYPDGKVDGTLGYADLDGAVAQQAVTLMRRTGSKTFPFNTTVGEFEVFVDVFPPPPTLLVFGAVHIAIPLVKMAKELGFRVKVVDGREKFLTGERFPEADELIFAWPDEAVEQLKIDGNTYIVILSHDEKFDEPALQSTLPSEARYIGAIGSRTTVAKRIDRLKKLGLTEAQISKVHGPIGMEIGAKEPAEIAISILAEIIAVKYGVVN